MTKHDPESIKKAKSLSTFNARDDRITTAWTYRNAWKRGQTCIIPADAFWEPDWRSTKHVPTRFTRVDGEPMGIAGIWDRWQMPEGTWLESYSMPTINADKHELMKHYHRSNSEKRMIIVLPKGAFKDWLTCEPDEMMNFMQPFAGATITPTPAVL